MQIMFVNSCCAPVASLEIKSESWTQLYGDTGVLGAN